MLYKRAGNGCGEVNVRLCVSRRGPVLEADTLFE